MSPSNSGSSPEDSMAAVAAALAESGEMHLTAFVQQSDEELLGYALNPTTSLQEKIRDLLRGEFAGLQAKTPVPYTPGRKPDDYEIAYASVEEFQTLVTMLSQVEQVTPTPLLDLDEVPRGGLRAVVTTLGKANPGWIHLIKTLRQTSQLKRSKRLALIRREDGYDELDSDAVLVEPGIDAVAVDEVVLMASQQRLERLLHAVEAAGMAARETLEGITAALRIENSDELMSAAQGDLNMISKIRGIEVKLTAKPEYREAMTMERVVPFVLDRPELGIELVGEPGAESLVFRNDPSQRWKILKLLDDDYLHSLLTETDYEANSKSAL